MPCLQQLKKRSCAIFFFLICSYIIFLLSNFYSKGQIPSHKSYFSEQKFNIAQNCSISQTIGPQNQMMSSNQSPIVILLWTWPSGHTFPLNECPPSVDSVGCFFTVNRTMFSVANAVVIHHRDVSGSKSVRVPDLPRPPHQYWIWFSQESPSNLRNLTIMDNIINMTMSYRVDSDIFTPYGWLEKYDGKESFTIPNKTGLVAWVVSNWKPTHKRFQYFTELKPHIQVDLYGKYHKPLQRNLFLQTLSKYKFYLSFENSIHEDYITEKLWRNAFLTGTVPVVMGPPRKNYERFIPPDSFIHVDDFSSPKELASYLHNLDKDDQKYRQYFKWRSKYQPVKPRKTWVTEYCAVCKAVKEAPLYRTIPSIAEWFK